MAEKTGWTATDSINWDNVSTDAPPPLADGIYRATIEQAEPEPTKEGKPGVKLQLLVTHAYGGNKGDLSRKVFDKLVFDPAILFKVKGCAEGAGCALPPTMGLDDVAAFCGSLVDSDGVWIQTKQNEFKGKVNARVDRYLVSEEVAAERAAAFAGRADAPAASDSGTVQPAAKPRKRGAA